MEDDAADELRQVVRSFVRSHVRAGEQVAAAGSADGYDRQTWQRLTELGLSGLTVPERFGGSGATAVELGAALEELGRELYGGPCLATAGLAVPVLLAIGDSPVNDEYLPKIAAGDVVATLAWGGPSPLDTTLEARERDGAWTVSGIAPTVLHAADADLVVVLARAEAGVGVFIADARDAAVAARPTTALDPTRNLGALAFTDTPVQPVGQPGTHDESLRIAFHHAVLAVACEQLGGIRRVLEMSVEYSATRFQFGRPIGSFQVVKHRCADMLVDTELALSVVRHACWAAVHAPSELPQLVQVAGALCGEIYTRSALTNIQNHGGIGFTWEHSAHLYLKRAKTDELLIQAPWRYRAELADLLHIPQVAT